MKQQLRYWDSDCFLGWLKDDEPDKAQACEGVIRNAEKREILIITSALTLAEVIKLKKKLPIPSEAAERVRDFFKHDFIEVRNVDRRLAEIARELVWKHDLLLDPKDAIHVATAVDLNIPILDTFDGNLIKLDGVIGNPPLRIGRPNIVYQEQEELFKGGRRLNIRPKVSREVLFRKFERISDVQENILFRSFGQPV